MVFLLLKIDADGSLSSSEFLSKLIGMVSYSKNNPNCFFHWFVIQLFHYIFTSFEYCLVGRRMCFNADFKSYLSLSLNKRRSLVKTSGLLSISRHFLA